MSYSLKWIVGLLLCALLAAPASLYVQHVESQRQARASAFALTGGDVQAGRSSLQSYGCGGCHEIAGIAGAEGKVGPSLKGIAKRSELAGRLSDDPQQLIRWIRQPQTVDPGNGMPDLNVTEKDGRDMAAYIYSTR